MKIRLNVFLCIQMLVLTCKIRSHCKYNVCFLGLFLFLWDTSLVLQLESRPFKTGLSLRLDS